MPRAPRPRDIDREAQAREILRRLLQGTQRLALRQLCALRAAACLRARQGRDRPLLLVQALDKEERAMTKRKARQPETASLAAISSEDARRYRAEEAMRTLMHIITMTKQHTACTVGAVPGDSSGAGAPATLLAERDQNVLLRSLPPPDFSAAAL